MCQIMKDETECHRGVLSFCCADLNCGTTDLPTLNQMIEDGQWIDCGARASQWGGIDEQYTCKASKVAAESRIDFIFVNTPLYPAVRGFQVDYCDEYSAHQPLQLKLDAGALTLEMQKHRKQ